MRHRRPRRGRHGLLLQRPQPLYVCCDNPVCRLFHRGGPARALFALRGVIRGTVAWQPCLVSAMDSSTIVRAAPGTVIPIVVAAAAVGAVARVCATSGKQDARGNEDHCVTPAEHQQSEVQAEHHPDISSSTPVVRRPDCYRTGKLQLCNLL